MVYTNSASLELMGCTVRFREKLGISAFRTKTGVGSGEAELVLL